MIRLFILLLPSLIFANFSLGDFSAISAKVQTKSYLDNELVASGTGQLYAKKNKGVRWEINGEIYLIDSKSVWHYQPQLKQVLHYPQVPQQFNAIKWLLDDSNAWVNQYRVSRSDNHIELISFNNLERIHITSNKQGPLEIIWESENEKMIFNFSGVKDKLTISETQLDPTFPKNTDIINLGENR